MYAVGLANILWQAVMCSAGFSASETTYPVVKREILLRKIF